MKVNIRYLPIKAHYFFYWGGTACLWPYMSVFGKQMGISQMGVGFIFAVAPIAGLIAKPLFGAIADRFKKKKMLFLFFILLNLMSYLCVAFLPQSPPVRPVNLECSMGQSYIRQCDRLTSMCAESLIESFKPEPVRLRSIRQRQNKTDSENKIRNDRAAIEQGRWLETCSGFCNIHGFVEGIEFCNNIMNRENQPEICQKMRSSPQPQLDRMLLSSMRDNRTTASPTRFSSFSSMRSGRGPLSIHFDVKIKITDVLTSKSELNPDSDCLMLPIDDIAFAQYLTVEDESSSTEKSVEGVYRGLSCYPQTFLTDCFIDCPNNTALNRYLETVEPEEELLDSMNFWMYGSLVVIAWIALAVVESMADAMCFQTLGDEPEMYGRQRLWGTIGWGSFSLISGYCIDTKSQGKLLKDYTPSFYLMAGLLTINLIVSYKWSVREVEKTKSLRRDLCSLLSNLRIVVFIIACVIVGMCTGITWSFLFWHIEKLAENYVDSCEAHNYTKILEGLISAVQCFGGELPFFFISGWLIKKLGQVHCITVVLAAFGVRFLMYSFLTNPWTFLPVELLQGVTYGVFYSTMVSYANKISPPGTAATVQGVVQSAFLGIGVATGSLVGGLIFNRYGGSTMFRVFGIGCLIFCAIHALIMCILNKKTNYGFPSVDRTEPEGQEMFKISNSNQDVADSDEGGNNVYT